MKRIFSSQLLIVIIVALFFYPVIFGKLPIPSDTIIGLYHPYRDLYAKTYPNGIPFQNFLITDPVRQQYPWRYISQEQLQKAIIPLWNPFAFSGTPLLANFQSASFYPFNILFFLSPFSWAWSILVFLQPLLSSIFMYLYLRTKLLSKTASLFGGLVFAFCGFSVAWLEWGTVVQTALWLPLILFAIEKIVKISEQKNKNKSMFIWHAVFIGGLSSSLLAGHLQTFIYVFAVVILYLLLSLIRVKDRKIVFSISMSIFLFVLITSIQWVPTLQFILLSAREIDQSWLQSTGWFIPWQHLIQFLVPDFFGNPTTLNYWGVWNYAEFIGYVSLLPLLLAAGAILNMKKNSTILFFSFVFFLSLIFALPTILAKIPYILQIPFLATTQPTRLLFLIDFSLAVLAAFGYDLLQKKKSIILWPLITMLIFFFGLWLIVLLSSKLGISIQPIDIATAKRNLILPTGLLLLLSIGYAVFSRVRNERIVKLILTILVLITIGDLFRFAWKFTPFTNREYIFPQTKTLTFLKQQKGQFRILSTDSRILPPNFSAIYKLQSVEGYDPLYLKRYAELIAASERGRPDINPPFGFNRIITPHRVDSRIINLLGVKYILSLTEINQKNLKKVFQEGKTIVYENKEAFPRVFFVENVKRTYTKKETIQMLFGENIDLHKTAIVEIPFFPGEVNIKQKWTSGEAKIIDYRPDRIIIKTSNKGDGFLVLTDTYYPNWNVSIKNDRQSEILGADPLLTNYNFRGIIVPSGTNTITFSINLFSGILND